MGDRTDIPEPAARIGSPIRPLLNDKITTTRCVLYQIESLDPLLCLSIPISPTLRHIFLSVIFKRCTVVCIKVDDRGFVTGAI